MSYFENIKLQYETIKDRLLDGESIRIFEARTEYFITKNIKKLEDTFFDREKEWCCNEVDNIMKKLDKKADIVLFGAGKVGKKTKQYLNACGYYPICFCDNMITSGTRVDGISVISVDEVIEKHSNSVIIICSPMHITEMCSQLIENGYDKERILIPGGGRLQILTGWQYFDVFTPNNTEIFIDVGGYDGNTISDFFKWMNTRENGKCYSLEPVPKLYNAILKRSRDENWKGKVILCNVAAWNREEELSFAEDIAYEGQIWGGSRVAETGKIKVHAKDIDAICSEEDRVTFIKMDIEGSELKALEGAKNTIIKNKPRLAICVYHKPMDILEIPSYILNLVPEYKFYIRQYSADHGETVLYATV